jgi:hypothetical protein
LAVLSKIDPVKRGNWKLTAGRLRPNALVLTGLGTFRVVDKLFPNPFSARVPRHFGGVRPGSNKGPKLGQFLKALLHDDSRTSLRFIFSVGKY